MKFFTNSFIRAAKVTEIDGEQVTVETGEAYTVPNLGVFVGDYLVNYGPQLQYFAAYTATDFEAQFREI